MDSDVRAAMERLRANQYDVATENREEGSGTQLEADHEMLAEAFLAEHPADDGEAGDALREAFVVIEVFRDAMAKYELDLKSRRHGGVAAGECLETIARGLSEFDNAMKLREQEGKA